MSAELTPVKWDWADTRVHPALRYPSLWVDDTNDETNEPNLALVESFNPRINTPKDVINSNADSNQGFVSKAPEYYFDVTCKPYGDGYDLLQACQNGDRYFDVILQPIASSINESEEVAQPNGAWGPGLEVFQGCKVLSVNERYAFGTAPTVTFSCRALRFALGEGEDQRIFGNGRAGRGMISIPGLTS